MKNYNVPKCTPMFALYQQIILPLVFGVHIPK